MSDYNLSLACSLTDRTSPLYNEQIQPSRDDEVDPSDGSL